MDSITITLIIGFIGLVLTIISAGWLSAYQFRDSLNQLDKRLSEIDKRFAANLSEIKIEIKATREILEDKFEARFQILEERLEANKSELQTQIRALDDRLENTKVSLEERMEANKSELRAEILAVKSDLSFNYNERLGEVQIRLDRIEKDVYARLEQLEKQPV